VIINQPPAPAPDRGAAQERRLFWLKTFFAVIALGAVLDNNPGCIPLVIAAALMWAPVRAQVHTAIVNLSKEIRK
jgi:hypothetical protein